MTTEEVTITITLKRSDASRLLKLLEKVESLMRNERKDEKEVSRF